MGKSERATSVLEASGLPGECYTGDAFFRAEIAHIHRRNWLFAGRVEEIAAPGDYRAIETVGGPVILLRDREGSLRAFANCCRHRGSLLLEGSGNIPAISCPYHAWSYRLDGSLIAAPDMDRTIGFDKAEQGLAPVRLEIWQGFIFLNFDADAPDLATHLGNLPEMLGGYRFDEMVCTWRQEIECRCNWKLLVENALETYHTGLVHARTVGAQTSISPATTGEWVTLQVLSATSVAVLTDAPPFPPIACLSAEAKRGTYFTMILPTTQFACAQDAMWWLAVRPLAPDRTVLSLGGCFPRSTVALPDFAAKAGAYYDRWARVAAEDVGILEKQQRGLASSLYRPGRLSWRDDLVHAVHEWVRARVPDGR
ncbi:MAG TPA: aromatic ring-hydroxylating dioxygenase subunit alpha [Stellaceae bacterium]|jgi:phenylpropionate dioxygenase-like ring-hydroxylating dioxygenase large terminal subunit|nr:aromatic ring-hydroxylating dioxygenase subunit alpha [Stellaceae bacterium]